MSLCLTRPVISDFGRYFIKASITFSIHLTFFFWPFRKWNVKLTNQCWWTSRKQRSSSQKMFVYSSWQLRGAGFSWRFCDLWERGANWRNIKIIFLGVNFKNYFILFKYIKIVLQANVKDVLCSLKEKKIVWHERHHWEKSYFLHMIAGSTVIQTFWFAIYLQSECFQFITHASYVSFLLT